jgi:hypothetical protein
LLRMASRMRILVSDQVFEMGFDATIIPSACARSAR